MRLMDKNLLDKEVLCIIDTRQIQKYIFHVNDMSETIGANSMLSHLMQDAFIYAVEHIAEPLQPDEYSFYLIDGKESVRYFDDEYVKIHVISSVANNMLVLFRTGALCRDIVRKISRYYLDNTYSLCVSAAYVEKTEDISYDLQELFKVLGQTKSIESGSRPLEALSVARIEKNTGEPVAFIDNKTGEEYSRAIDFRRREYSRLKDALTVSSVNFTRDRDGQEYYAVAHIDGNNMHATITAVTDSTSDYRDNINIRRQIDRNIQNGIAKAIQDSVNETKKALEISDEEFEHEFRIVHIGGDDLNIISNASVIFTFLEKYMSHMKDVVIWQSDENKVSISACAGVAFVEKSTPFIDAFSIAEDCCDNAKKYAKEEEHYVNGCVGNWVDFTVAHSDSPMIDDRENRFVTQDGVHLFLRPYCFDAPLAGTPHSYYDFKKRALCLRKTDLPVSVVSGLADISDIGIMNTGSPGSKAYYLFSDIFEDITDSLEKQIVKPLVRSEGKMYATLYDALETQAFFPVKGR